MESSHQDFRLIGTISLKHYTTDTNLNRFGFDEFVPVTAFTSLGGPLVQPEPRDARGVFFANAAHDTRVIGRRHGSWTGLGARSFLTYFHLERILEKKTRLSPVFSNSSLCKARTASGELV